MITRTPLNTLRATAGAGQRLSALALSLWLAACSAPIRQSQPEEVSTQPGYSQEAVQGLLLEARAAQSPARETLLLEAAEQLVLLEDADWARNLLASIDPELLSGPALWRYTLTYADLALADESLFVAQRVLMNPRLASQWELMPRDTYLALRERRASLAAQLGETEQAVNEYISLENAGLAPEARSANQTALWQALMALPWSELQRLAATDQAPEQRGWYQLAALAKNNQHQLESQQAGIDQWRAQWPGHPAAANLPDDLKLLQQLIAEQPRHLALMLPLSGKLGRAGRAIRDGFFAAYYQAQQTGGQLPVISLYDTNLSDLASLYQRAQADGAELVVGPLDKDRVTELALMPELPLPTLALNRAESTGELPPPPQLAQFGLAAEDEARQAARRAWLEGHRLAMVIAVDANWADRSALAFIDEWNNLGGTVVDYTRFTGNADYSKAIQRGLLIDQSRSRAANVRNVLGRAMEFEPRRRQDVDVIFITALPNQARQVKPTLKFHQAADIPVYATSHIYTGEPDPKLDSDLNGIRFSTLPWLFDTSSPEKAAIEHYSRDPAFNRLYAMGVDAYHLFPRLRQLKEIPNARLFGATGNLQLQANGQIAREQMWAIMRAGKVRPLPMVVSTDSVRAE